MKLQRMLNDMLRGPRPRRADPEARERAAFRRLANKHGLAFKKCRDGYVEAPATEQFPKGIAFAHYDWPESLERLRYVLDNPSALDDDGYYSE
jgi:hypothetical protein